MTVKDQIQTLKNNWLLFSIGLGIFVFAIFFLPGLLTIASSSFRAYDGASSGGGYYPSAASEQMYDMAKSSSGSSYYPSIYDNRNFAPDEADRKIMKTVTMSTEVKRGQYKAEDTKLKSIITSSNSFLLTENVNKNGDDWNSYYTGYYTIKVDVTKYDNVVGQLKEIGEVKSFAVSKDDITGQYQKAEIELGTEKSRLERYNQMYKEATLVADKITLNDRIFDEERTIKYMQDRIDNMDKSVEYSTIYFYMNEKRSEYANIVFVKFSELVSSLVSSTNSMLRLLFSLVPWAVFIGIVVVIIRLAHRREQHKKK
jgi:hypothetical protein